MVEGYLANAGTNGRVKLAAKADVSLSTVDNVLGKRASARPMFLKPRTTYKLALACGCTEEEAMAIVTGLSSEAAKESA